MKKYYGKALNSKNKIKQGSFKLFSAKYAWWTWMLMFAMYGVLLAVDAVGEEPSGSATVDM